MIRVVILLVLLVTALVGLFVWTRPSQIDDTATALYLSGNLSGTIKLVANSAEPSPKAILLVANCYRQLGMHRQFAGWIERALINKNAAEEIELAQALYKIHNGKVEGSARELTTVLLNAGALPSDARSAVVLGTFAAEKLIESQNLLDDWRSQEPESAQLSYLSAVMLNINGDEDAAEAKLISTAERFPSFELAWLALSDFYSRPPNVRFEKAELVLQRMTGLFAHNTDARFRLAKIQRRLGRNSSATADAVFSEAEVLEQAKMELDQGHVASSLEKLQSIGLSEPKDVHKLTDAAFQLSLTGRGDQGGELTHSVSWIATALALNGEQAASLDVFEVAADRTARLRRLQDVNNKQTLFPQQQTLVDEANALVSPAYTPNYPTLGQLAPASDKPIADLPGLAIYRRLCATCHGANGDGLGRAACNLNPAPRNFRTEPIRLVSTENRVPSDSDLIRTIQLGEPGTSMPAFTNLSSEDIQSLVQLLRHFINEGWRERYENESGEGTESNVSNPTTSASKWILDHSQPGVQVVVPELKSSESVIARGRVLFESAGCNQCHSTAATGPAERKRLFDSVGRPIGAPNLSTDFFHSGNDARYIYLRIALGIPGTPHPALAQSSADEIAILTAFIQFIRSPNPTPSTNFERSVTK